MKQGEKRPYVRKEEILYENKRYRIHNSYLSFGPGFLVASNHNNAQKNLGIDFQFHVRTLRFQAGLIMSGEEFRSNNNIGGHFGYGLRKETKTKNFAAYLGASFNTGVLTIVDSAGIHPHLYQGGGIYMCVQAVTKITYDFGIGAELFSEISTTQSLVGLRLTAFFSGAYMGPKRTVNPNVRLETK